jgi:hypothetical protein
LIAGRLISYFLIKAKESDAGTSVNKAKMYAGYLLSVFPDFIISDSFFSDTGYFIDIFTGVSTVSTDLLYNII